jgi:hypothetical protein
MQQEEYLKDKINELAWKIKNKNIRDLERGNEFNRGHQTGSNLVKHENGDLLADSHNISNRLKNYFSQLLNVHNVSDVRQIEVHTAEPLVLYPSLFECEIAVLQISKSINRQLVIKFWQNLFKQGVKHYGLRSTNSFILFEIRKNCLISGRSPLKKTP